MLTSFASNKKRLDWTGRADNDRFEAWRYICIEDGSHLNADLVYARITNSVEMLADFPLMGKPWKRGFRLLLVTHTQYTVVYRVLVKSIRILRVFHQKQKALREALNKSTVL